MVAHAQLQDALVDSQSRSIEYKVLWETKKEVEGSSSFRISQSSKMNLISAAVSEVWGFTVQRLLDSSNTYLGFLVYGLDDEFLIIERNVSNFTPGKADLWRQPGKWGKKETFFYVYLYKRFAAGHMWHQRKRPTRACRFIMSLTSLGKHWHGQTCYLQPKWLKGKVKQVDSEVWPLVHCPPVYNCVFSGRCTEQCHNEPNQGINNMNTEIY